MTTTAVLHRTLTPDAIGRRLRPLHAAQFLQGVAPWVPVEKLFMTEIGFTPASVATMAAAYAVVVPVLEIPSGILADRWSRRGVLMLAGGAGLASVAVGALAQHVAAYLVSAVLLGVYFALQSGTVDSIVYDVLLEDAGSADTFEARFGRIQLLGSLALTGSALAGGVLAQLTSARATYVLTLPFALAGLLVLSRFREPTLHRRQVHGRLRTDVADIWRTVAAHPRVASIVLASVLTAALMQLVFEFGPLWLLALGVAPALFGPYTAAMTATLGVGASLAPRLRLHRTGGAAGVAALLVGCAAVLVSSGNSAIVIGAQVVLIALLAAIGLHLSRLLHDAVPSSARTGVASGVSTLSWLTFLPASLLFGAASGRGGLAAGGGVLLALLVVTGAVLIRLAGRDGRHSSDGQRRRRARSTMSSA